MSFIIRTCELALKVRRNFYFSLFGDQTFSISAAAGINTPCTQPSQCSPFGAAFCPTAPPRCCSCHVYAKYNAINELCEVRNGLGGFCETTKDCKVENAACTPRNLCECKPNFVAQNESECKPSFAGECEATEDCAFENAECRVEMVDEKLPAKMCRCNDDFVKVDKTCLKKGLTRRRWSMELSNNFSFQRKATTIYATRMSSASPFSTKMLFVTTRNALALMDNVMIRKVIRFVGWCYHAFSFKSFFAALNEQYNKPSDCMVASEPPTVECRNGHCQCKPDYSPDSNQSQCIRPRQKSEHRHRSA